MLKTHHVPPPTPHPFRGNSSTQVRGGNAAKSYLPQQIKLFSAVLKTNLMKLFFLSLFLIKGFHVDPVLPTLPLVAERMNYRSFHPYTRL